MSVPPPEAADAPLVARVKRKRDEGDESLESAACPATPSRKAAAKRTPRTPRPAKKRAGADDVTEDTASTATPSRKRKPTTSRSTASNPSPRAPPTPPPDDTTEDCSKSSARKARPKRGRPGKAPVPGQRAIASFQQPADSNNSASFAGPAAVVPFDSYPADGSEGGSHTQATPPAAAKEGSGAKPNGATPAGQSAGKGAGEPAPKTGKPEGNGGADAAPRVTKPEGAVKAQNGKLPDDRGPVKPTADAPPAQEAPTPQTQEPATSAASSPVQPDPVPTTARAQPAAQQKTPAAPSTSCLATKSRPSSSTHTAKLTTVTTPVRTVRKRPADASVNQAESPKGKPVRAPRKTPTKGQDQPASEKAKDKDGKDTDKDALAVGGGVSVSSLQRKRIAPTHLAGIGKWTRPRRPFQTVVKVEKSLLKCLNLAEGDTNDLLDASSGSSDAQAPGDFEDSEASVTQESNDETSSQCSANHGVPPGTPLQKAVVKSPHSKSACSPHHPKASGAVQTTLAAASTSFGPSLGTADHTSARSHPPPPPFPPRRTSDVAASVSIGVDHIRVIATMTEQQALNHSIPLAFWSKANHLLEQHDQWCTPDDVSQSANALSVQEARLVDLVEKSVTRKTGLKRHRLRRESALRQLELGTAAVDTFGEATDGTVLRELRQTIADLDDRKRALEASINARTKQLVEDVGDVAAQANGVWVEPDFVQDGAERLELQQLRKDIAERTKELDRAEAERSSVARKAYLFRAEDASAFANFRTLNDRYLMVEILGKGGYSEVWKAFDKRDPRMVAVKVHQLEEAWSPEKKANYIRHARREYNIQKELIHPHIVRLFDCFNVSSASFATVMEISGHGDLAEYMEKHRTAREKDARIIIRQVLSALEHLNKGVNEGKKVIHYDVKPQNVLFFGELFVKLADFGLSKLMDSDVASIELTSHGAGTRSYLPPECFAGMPGSQRWICPKVDIWSTGVIFFQLLFGKKPFETARASFVESLIPGQVPQTLDVPSQPKVSKAAVDMVTRMLSRDPSARPSVTELLQAFLDEDGVPAQSVDGRSEEETKAKSDKS
ncbi:Serine/threonine-protein kinase TOUSLED [Diplonema papillatum]|nr:Serine/threonine-protein kinase TOUSLED [Diplonema papillatum]